MLGLLHVAGGVALLIFGFRFLRKGLDRVFGERLSTWLGRLTGNRLKGAAVGAGVSVLAPSSTTLSLLSVSLVRSGRLTMRQAMAVMLGAGVGLTLTVHLIAIDVLEHAPILVLFGVVLFQGLRSSGPRGLGQVLIGLGVIFMGVAVIRDATAPVAESADLQTLLGVLGRYPWLLATLGVGLAVLLQSSTATIALVLGLSMTSADVVTWSIALPVIVGANIGISVSTAIAGWSAVESKRMGLGLVALRALMGAAVLIAWKFVMDRWGAEPVGAVALATGHTAFNVVAMVGGLIGLGIAERVLTRLIRESPESAEEVAFEQIDERWAREPQIALAQSSRQVSNVAHLVVQMLRDFWRALEKSDEHLCYSIRERDDAVDRQHKRIKHFLTRQLAEDLTDEQAGQRVLLLRYVDDLETIGDVVDRSLVDLVLKRVRLGVRFSNEGMEELRSYCETVIGLLEVANAAFLTRSPEQAHRVLELKSEIRDRELHLREAHFARLQAGTPGSVETTDLHLEVLAMLKHIAHVAASVAYMVPGGPEPNSNGNGIGGRGVGGARRVATA